MGIQVHKFLGYGLTDLEPGSHGHWRIAADCPFCQDAAAYKAYVDAGGTDYRRNTNAEFWQDARLIDPAGLRCTDPQEGGTHA